MRKFEQAIERLVRGRTCFVGMGNYLRRDDAAGILLAEGLKEVADGRIMVMNVEDVVESYAFDIARCDADDVVFIDAVKTGEAPGTILFGRLDEFSEAVNDYSTHKCSLLLTGRVLEAHGKTAWLLGIESGDTDYGEGISERVQSSIEHLRDMIRSYVYVYRDNKELVYEH